MDSLLDENAVVDAVADFLAASGYEILQKLHGHQRGIDIVARRRRNGHLLHVEAKGGTSTRVGSAKFGKPMGGGEVRINIAEALYTAAVAATRARAAEDPDLVSAVAFPDDARHRKYADPLRPAFDRLGIGVFWVHKADSVTLEAGWSL